MVQSKNTTDFSGFLFQIMGAQVPCSVSWIDEAAGWLKRRYPVSRGGKAWAKRGNDQLLLWLQAKALGHPVRHNGWQVIWKQLSKGQRNWLNYIAGNVPRQLNPWKPVLKMHWPSGYENAIPGKGLNLDLQCQASAKSMTQPPASRYAEGIPSIESPFCSQLGLCSVFRVRENELRDPFWYFQGSVCDIVFCPQGVCHAFVFADQ